MRLGIHNELRIRGFEISISNALWRISYLTAHFLILKFFRWHLLQFNLNLSFSDGIFLSWGTRERKWILYEADAQKKANIALYCVLNVRRKNTIEERRTRSDMKLTPEWKTPRPKQRLKKRSQEVATYRRTRPPPNRNQSALFLAESISCAGSHRHSTYQPDDGQVGTLVATVDLDKCWNVRFDNKYRYWYSLTTYMVQYILHRKCS